MPPKKRRAPGDGALFKRTDGMWVGSVEIPTADGTRRQKRIYSKDYRKAKAKLDAARQDIADGIIPITANTTLAKWLTHWLEDIKRPNVSQNTYQFYEETVRLHINPKIGGRRLDRVTAQEIRHVINEANTTRNAQRVHMVMGMALKQAVSDGVLRRNVCAAVTKPGHVKTERKALTAAQAIQVINTGMTIQERSRWAAAFLTGARPAELRGLEWNRVDLANGVLDLSWQLQQLKQEHGCRDDAGEITCSHPQRVGYCPQRRWDAPAGREYRKCWRSLVWTRPKTKAGTRTVDISPELVDMLRLLAQETGPNPHNLVWHHRNGDPISPTYENKLWHNILNEAGMPQIEQYATRHTAATLWESMGVAEEVRMQIMGHSSAIAHQAYLHRDRSRTRLAVNGLGKMLITPEIFSGMSQQWDTLPCGEADAEQTARTPDRLPPLPLPQ